MEKLNAEVLVVPRRVNLMSKIAFHYPVESVVDFAGTYSLLIYPVDSVGPRQL